MRTEQQAVVVTSERQERTCPALPMLTPQEDSPLSLFEKSMTLAEREGSLDSWSRARVAEFIQAMSSSIVGVFENFEDAAAKAAISFCVRMQEAEVSEFHFTAAMRGSRFMVAEENFTGSISLGQEQPSAASEGVEKASSERSTREQQGAAAGASTAGQELGPKMNAIWIDGDGALALFDDVRQALGDTDGMMAIRDTSLLLIHLELVSQRNAATARTQMRGFKGSPGLNATIDVALSTKNIQAHDLSPARM